jgi:ABC-2 type transport system permease protein
VVLLSQMIELIITKNLEDEIPGIIPYFPMKSIWYLIQIPYPRYIFWEIQDYLEAVSVAVVIGWTVLFNYLAYFKLKRSDI